MYRRAIGAALAAWLALFCLPAWAQKTPAAIRAEINASIVPNAKGNITAAILNGILNDIAASYIPFGNNSVPLASLPALSAYSVLCNATNAAATPAPCWSGASSSVGNLIAGTYANTNYGIDGNAAGSPVHFTVYNLVPGTLTYSDGYNIDPTATMWAYRRVAGGTGIQKAYPNFYASTLNYAPLSKAYEWTLYANQYDGALVDCAGGCTASTNSQSAAIQGTTHKLLWNVTTTAPSSINGSITSIVGNGSTATVNYTGGSAIATGRSVYISGVTDNPAFNGVWPVASGGSGSITITSSVNATTGAAGNVVENSISQAWGANAVCQDDSEENNPSGACIGAEFDTWAGTNYVYSASSVTAATGSSVTVTLSKTPNPPIPVGHTIAVQGFNPPQYNCEPTACTVTASSGNSITYTSTATGAVTTNGSVFDTQAVTTDTGKSRRTLALVALAPGQTGAASHFYTAMNVVSGSYVRKGTTADANGLIAGAIYDNIMLVEGGGGLAGNFVNGLNLTNGNFSGNAFSSPGFAVDGTGAISQAISTAGQGPQGISTAVTQTAPNATDTSDAAAAISYTLNASSATNELAARSLKLSITNMLTGGGALSNMRGLEISMGNGLSSTVTSSAAVHISKTGGGSISAGYGLYVLSIAGTNSWAVYDTASTEGVYTAGGATTAPTTVAGLPTCQTSPVNRQGQRRFVTDAAAATFHTTAAGSGSNKVAVVCDGTNWYID